MKLIENPKLLDCHFKNGMMILPFYRAIIEARINKQFFASENAILSVSRKSQVVSLLKGLAYCKIKKKDILIFSSTLFNVKEDGHFHNCLHGFYYDLYPNDTLLIEDSDPSFMWRTNNSCENLSFVNTYIDIACTVLKRICHRISPIKNIDYDVIINEYPDLFTGDKLSQDDYFVKFYAFFIRWLLKKVDPKVLFVNCGSYGHKMAVVCYVAKQMGIKVIEPQHGVTYNCPGYMTADFIVNSSEYNKYLPDSLFSFGTYWTKFVKWKYEMVPVGYQYLNKYNSLSSEIIYDYLIISQPMDEEEEKNKTQFVKAISKSFPECKILFRTHPAESPKQQKTIYINNKNIEISESAKVLYEDFIKSRYVIGWYSNCLYECLAFNRIPIIVDSKYTRNLFPHNFGIWIKSPEELKMLDSNNNLQNINYSDFWSGNFEYNVTNYINKILKK